MRAEVLRRKRKRGENMSIDNTVLIERSKSGDCSAFSELASLYTIELYRFSLYMTGNKEDAEDAVHTVFLQIAKKYISAIVKIENPADLRNYLLTAVKNTALNTLQKNNRIIQVSDIAYENNKYVSDDEFTEYIIAKFEAEKVLTTIKNLDSTYKDVLYLHFVFELPPRDIAKQLNRKTDTVKKQIMRGKSILLNNLQGGMTDE